MASGEQDSGGQPPGGNTTSGLWPLSSLQSRYTRSAIDMAQELLPNLPRRALVSGGNGADSGASRSSVDGRESGDGHTTVDMESLMASGDEEPIELSPQMMARLEEIRALLRTMNARQQQQHAHTHLPSSTSSAATPAHGDHGHSHSPGEEGDSLGATASGIDLRSLMKLLQTSGVFFILLLLRFLYDHRLGLIVIIAMAGTFHFVNMKLVQCIHLTAVREVGAGRMTSVGYPLFLLSFLAVNITLIYYSFHQQALWNMLRYQMPIVAEVNIWTLLWIVLVSDFVIRFAVVGIKCCIFLLPAALLPHRRRIADKGLLRKAHAVSADSSHPLHVEFELLPSGRRYRSIKCKKAKNFRSFVFMAGKYYMFVEKLSQLYRHTIPILPWFHYLYDDQEISRWFAIITIVIYALFKAASILTSTKEIIKAATRLRMQMIFGSKPGSEELRQRGTMCPICQDDYKEPILLSCKHIFCENCVSLWFDREKTCPMCRAQITDDPQFQDGSSSSYLQWY